MSSNKPTPGAAASEAALAGPAAPALPGAATGHRAASDAAVTRSALLRQAEQYLESAGLRILDRNWRCADGEIDIVAADRRVLVACAVRTRSGTGHQMPAAAISQAKRSRLRRLAVRWLVARAVLFDEVRVDVVRLLRDQSGTVTIEHIRGAG
jgi:putative endonuclease